ncbi:hypothetical protein ACHWQZ_G015785 [Mnemiopsis leidyi]
MAVTKLRLVRRPVTKLRLVRRPVTKLRLVRRPVTKLRLVRRSVTKLRLLRRPVTKLRLLRRPVTKLRLVRRPVTKLRLVRRPVTKLRLVRRPVTKLRLLRRPVTKLRLVRRPVTKLRPGKNLRKVFIAGDFNLHSVEWPPQSTNTPIRVHKLFTDSFQELGLDQLITSPTHIKGKTLDLLLTNHSSLVSDVNVHSSSLVCKSDHSVISFKVKATKVIKRCPKRRIYNFKKANWDSLNNDISCVPWYGLIDSREPEIAWYNFKTILHALIDKNIPKITAKNNFSPPWFDSECFSAFRKKDRAHAQFKESNTFTNELRWKVKRRDFKNTCNAKMRDNLYNSEDPALITKKFWSHVKSFSKSHRLPECMHLNDTFRNSPKDKAELFNNYFYQQFSTPSRYDIDIDWSNDQLFDIDFSPERIISLLKEVNPNKASGPDGIHGQVLKHCARSLAHPLSVIFTLSYNSGCVPKDWRTANVVPVFKKGSKDDITNYRPISLTSLVMKIFERIYS